MENKCKCPRCKSEEFDVMGTDDWSFDMTEDVIVYYKCLACNLLYWYSSFFREVDTNWRDAL